MMALSLTNISSKFIHIIKISRWLWLFITDLNLCMMWSTATTQTNHTVKPSLWCFLILVICSSAVCVFACCDKALKMPACCYFIQLHGEINLDPNTTTHRHTHSHRRSLYVTLSASLLVASCHFARFLFHLARDLKCHNLAATSLPHPPQHLNYLLPKLPTYSLLQLSGKYHIKE